MEEDELIKEAVLQTFVRRAPRQALATFGATAIRYYLVTEPALAGTEFSGGALESVIREGVVHAERPVVVTPYYLLNHEGFGRNASKYLEDLIREVGPDAPGLLYSYRNEGMETSIVSGGPDEVAERISSRLDKEDKRLEAVIQGIDELWDVCLMKFIYELTNSSARSNISEMRSHGLLALDRGLPTDVRLRIDSTLEAGERGKISPSEVQSELRRWGVFDEYQDRFFEMLKRRRR